MNTVYKLSRRQFSLLYDVYQTQVAGKEFKTPVGKLVHTLQLQVWLKLRRLDVEVKPKYKLPLTPAEEQAFMIYWGQFNIPFTDPTGHVIQTLVTLIHPKYV